MLVAGVASAASVPSAPGGTLLILAGRLPSGEQGGQVEGKEGNVGR